jgi:hypothetical protein
VVGPWHAGRSTLVAGAAECQDAHVAGQDGVQLVSRRGLAVVVVGVLVAAVVLGVVAVKHNSVSTQTSLAGCTAGTQLEASLFSDDQTTAIRLSQPDLKTMKVLRTEPAAVLPGMFDALLAVSPDAGKVAYVTARNELMDDAHVYSIDVAHPDQRTELATVPVGLWPVRPVWSPDASRLAYAVADSTSPYTFKLWVADAGTGKTAVRLEYPREDFLPPAQPSLCWTSNSEVTLIGNRGSAASGTGSVSGGTATGTSSSGSAQSSSGSAAPTPGGAECALPVMSQNDPRWRQLFMRYAGDSIGGYGCALTSTAMVLNYFGVSTNVSLLNDCMGSNADPLFWGVAPRCSGGLVQGGVLAAFSWDRLDAVLAKGDPEIVGVVRGQTGSHFVVVTSGGGQVADGYHITDPWDGTTNKTLGYYQARGYNLDWLVTYSGTSHGCGRLSDDLGIHVSGFSDGGNYTGPVHVDPGQNSNYDGPVQIGQVGGPGALTMEGPTPEASGTSTGSSSATSSPSGSTTTATSSLPSITFTFTGPQIFTLVPLKDILFNPIPLGGITLVNEGVYEVLIHVKVGPTVQLVTEKFTIDKTPPTLVIDFLDPVAIKAAATKPPPPPLPFPFLAVPNVETPLLERPGQLQIPHHDSLSGVHEIDYSLDGGAWTPYTDQVNDMRVLSVDQVGPHTISIKGIDLAGNQTGILTQPFIVVDVVAPPLPTPTPAATPTPSPSPSSSSTSTSTTTSRSSTTTKPTPTPTPPPTPTPTPKPTPTPTPCPVPTVSKPTATWTFNQSTGLDSVDVAWSGTGFCNVSSTLVGYYDPPAPPAPRRLGSFPGASGQYTDTVKDCSYRQIYYIVTLTDSQGHTVASPPSDPVQPCS